MRSKIAKKILTVILVGTMAIQSVVPYVGTMNISAEVVQDVSTVVIDVTEFGADKLGVNDSTEAVQQALEAAKVASKEGTVPVTLNFPKGEYQFYADKAFKREFHTSNTNSIENPIKTINILIEEQKNLTIEGNDSLFMMHGNTMALAVVKSENVKLQNFAWDYAAATNSEMTVAEMGTDESGKQYTDYFIPTNCPFEISGTNINWNGGRSPETGEYYWTKQNEHSGWTRVGYNPITGVIRRYNTSPFQVGRSSITKINDNKIRVTYSGSRPAPEVVGFTWEFCATPMRMTSGAFIWESKDTVVSGVDVHFLNQFGWLTQMSENVTFSDCNFMPRSETGRLCTSYADLIHVSGAKGKVKIENCNFSHALDDPINIHGTFTRVVSKMASNKLQLEYVENQQGGFQQYHIGDEVVFAARDGLTPLGGKEVIYTVTDVVNPFESGLNGKNMYVTFDKELPDNITDQVSGQMKYVAENITYTPEVEIRANDFATIPTRGILCTTRKKVVIDNNIFKTQGMESIFLSNDSNAWYESGPIKDLTISNNTFYITSSNATGGNNTDNQSAIHVHPEVKNGLPSSDSPVHENIAIIGNKFYMEKSMVVEAESVKNLTIKNNEIYRKDPNINIALTSTKTELSSGESTVLDTNATGNTLSADLFSFTKCNTVNISGNKFDDGLKYNIANSGSANINNEQSELSIGSGTVQPAVSNIKYTTTDATVATVDQSGKVIAKGAGKATIYAYYEWDGQKIKSNSIEFTVTGDVPTEVSSIRINEDDNMVITDTKDTTIFTAEVEPADAGTVTWAVVDAATQNASSIASISTTGELTVTGSGVIEVQASVGNHMAKRTVVISLPEVTKTLETGFTMNQETADKWAAGDDANSLKMKMQEGDLYGSWNAGGAGVKNLLTFDEFGTINKDALRAEVSVNGLPSKSGQSLTASFILYKDNDNYVTVGKKGHITGLAVVNESAANAAEVAGSADDNNITNGRFALEKSGDTVTAYFKATDSTEWKKITEVTNSSLGTEYKIGFAVWAPTGYLDEVTFSNFKVGDMQTAGTELDTATIPFLVSASNTPAMTSEVTLDQESYDVGAQATVTGYKVGETTNEGAVLYRFATTSGGNDIKYVYTTNSTYTVSAGSTMTAVVYAKDASGRYAIPSGKEATINSVDSYKLSDLSINGASIEGFTSEVSEYTVEVPEGTQKVELAYTSENENTGTTKVEVNGVESVKNNNDTFVVSDITDGSTITVKRMNDTTSQKSYKITVRYIKDSSTKLDAIVIPEISLNNTSCTTDAYSYSAQGNRKLNVTVNAAESAKAVEVSRTYYKVPVVDTNKKENVFQGQLDLNSGANIFYVNVTAQDGITKKTYIMTVVSDGDTNAKLSDIKVDNVSIADFESDTYQYELADVVTKEVNVEAVAASETATVEYFLNGNKLESGVIPFESFAKGVNEIRIRVKAGDKATTKEYVINAFVSAQDNAKLKSVTIDGVIFDSAFNADITTYNLKAVNAESKIKVEAQENDANIKITYRSDSTTGKKKAEKDLSLYKGSNQVVVEVTAPDGSTKQTYTFNLAPQEFVYLSDMAIDSEPLIGYAAVKKDTNTSGTKIKLPDANGNAVAYDKGLGAHASSKVVYDISEMGYKTLTGFVGIDYVQYANATATSSVTFKIYLDDSTTAVFDSGVMEKTTPQKQFTVDVTGAKKITLFADQGQNDYNDHADWADIKFVNEFPDEPEEPVVPVESVNLSKDKVELKVGATETIIATVNPSNATDQAVTWATDKASVATVVVGKITAVGAGTAKITATAGGKTATCVVTVTKEEPPIIAVESINLSKDKVELKVGATETIIATVNPSNATEQTITWSTDKAAVATVADGKITAVGAGTAKITATAGGKSATCTVTVTKEEPPIIVVESVNLSKDKVELKVGATETIIATVNPNNATDQTVTWSTDKAAVATVADGKITAVGEGTAKITATAGGKTATCTVIVTKVQQPIHPVNGWDKIGDKWKYYKNNIAVKNNWVLVDGAWYYMGEDEFMKTKWQLLGGKWYYLGINGKMATKWRKIDSVWYYFNKSGAMVTNWQKIDNTWYYFNKSGKMQTNWYKEGKTWYYLKANGAMATGWVKVDGKSYYLNKDTGAWNGQVR